MFLHACANILQLGVEGRKIIAIPSKTERPYNVVRLYLTCAESLHGNRTIFSGILTDATIDKQACKAQSQRNQCACNHIVLHHFKLFIMFVFIYCFIHVDDIIRHFLQLQHDIHVIDTR